MHRSGKESRVTCRHMPPQFTEARESLPGALHSMAEDGSPKRLSEMVVAWLLLLVGLVRLASLSRQLKGEQRVRGVGGAPPGAGSLRQAAGVAAQQLPTRDGVQAARGTAQALLVVEPRGHAGGGGQAGGQAGCSGAHSVVLSDVCACVHVALDGITQPSRAQQDSTAAEAVQSRSSDTCRPRWHAAVPAPTHSASRMRCTPR